MKQTIERDLELLALLRENSRETLTNLSKKTGIPISTLYDRVRVARQKGLIKRFTAILNYEAMGYGTRALVIVRAGKDMREKLREFLSFHPHVNCLYKVNNGYDFLFEGIFSSMRDFEFFLEEMETQYRVRTKQVFYLLEEICEQEFLSGPLGVRDGELELEDV